MQNLHAIKENRQKHKILNQLFSNRHGPATKIILTFKFYQSLSTATTKKESELKRI